MADSQIHSLALQDILLSMAEALNKAQNELNNMAPYDEYGRPNTIYHVPYLDFNLQVVTEFENAGVSTTTPAGIGGSPVLKSAAAMPLVTKAAAKAPAKTATKAAAKTAVAAAVAAPALMQAAPQQRAMIRFMPVQTAAPVNTATKNSARIESSISGRFVAVVPNEGVPQIFILSETTKPTLKSGVYVFTIKAQVKNAVNEVMANTRVEFNFDAATSGSLSTIPIAIPPVFTKNEGLTDSQGWIDTEISLNASDYNNNSTFCFVINTSNIQKTISVSK
jgi:hypothetical protein